MLWNRSIGMKERLGIKGETYKGRPIIERDSRIDGGVCLGRYRREAIVVDSSYSPYLVGLYNIVEKGASIGDSVMRDRILKSVFINVVNAMPKQDENAVANLVRKHNVGDDGLISLETFVREGTGVCRHDALICAFLLEKFKDNGFIRGKPSVDRNYHDKGAHAWCRYTSHSGTVVILDVMQKYFGLLKNSGKNGRWDYRRPEDI